MVRSWFWGTRVKGTTFYCDGSSRVKVKVYDIVTSYTLVRRETVLYLQMEKVWPREEGTIRVLKLW